MIIDDLVWGKVEVEEPVLLELMESSPVVRLDSVAQFSPAGTIGYPYPSYTRKGHSVGAMLLLEILRASLEERIKGLLHDTPHLAMAHIGEWALGKDESFHDTRFKQVIMGSEIPSILEKYGQNLDKILSDDGFDLLERDIPELCADRVDYSLREIALCYNKTEARELASHVINYEGRIRFDTKAPAQKFGNWFLAMQTGHWGSPRVVAIFDILSKTMKYALDKGVLVPEDLEKTDKDVADKLFASTLPYIQKSLSILGTNFEPKENLIDPQIKAMKKFRHIDPSYVEKGKVYTLTETDPEYCKSLEWHRSVNAKGVNVDLYPSCT